MKSTNIEPHPLLGKVMRWELGRLLGGDFDKFDTGQGIRGAAKTIGDRLEILAIDAYTPGKGQGRAFIERAKEMYAVIIVHEVWNQHFAAALKRYGFEHIVNGKGDRYEWHRNK